ncbi:lipopolysaccharide biosynthesis protein [Cellulomonas sp.]|uniref:lipopolysaccharide biosynthesis protein n=1 Tax=Cellulomonas sp. TaxID=40001 RepID=UPI003BABC0E1
MRAVSKPGEPAAGLGREAATGTLWLAAQKWVVRLSGLVTIAILTRQLSAREFGVIAAATALTPFVLLLSDLGFTTYLTQAGELSKRTLDTAFWLTISAAIVLGGALALGAPFAAALLGVPEATDVIRVLAATVVVVVAGSVPIALMRRRMEFRRLAVQGTVASVAGQIVAIALALAGYGVWALVAQVAVLQVVGTSLAWITARWHPGLSFDRRDMVTMGRFGISVVGVELIDAGRYFAETAIIARGLGQVPLGYYAIAQRLIQVAQDLAAAAVVPVSTVVFAKIRSSPERLASAYVRATRITWGAVVPVMGFLAVGSTVVIEALFGDGWEPSAPAAQALSVAAILTMGAVIDHGLFYGTGRPGTWLVYAIVVDAVTLAVTAIAAPHGIAAIGWGFAAVAFAATVARWVLLRRLLVVRLRTLSAPLFATLVPAALAVAAAWATMRWAEGAPAVLTAAAGALVVAVVYVPLLALLAPSTFTAATDILPLPRRLRLLIGKMPFPRQSRG